MKHIVAILWVFILAIGLTACGSNSEVEINIQVGKQEVDTTSVTIEACAARSVGNENGDSNAVEFFNGIDPSVSYFDIDLKMSKYAVEHMRKVHPGKGVVPEYQTQIGHGFKYNVSRDRMLDSDGELIPATQFDWGQQSTLEQSGCVPTSAAMTISSVLGRDVDVSEVLKHIHWNRHVGAVVYAIADQFGAQMCNAQLQQKYGLAVEPMASIADHNVIRECLKEGYSAVVLIHGSHHGMAICDYDETTDSVVVLDPSPSSFTEKFTGRGPDSFAAIRVYIEDLFAAGFSGAYFVGV